MPRSGRRSLTFDGQEFTGSVNSNSLGGAEPNAWSVIVEQSAIDAIQKQADAGDGTLSDIPVTATVSDAAGNEAETPPDAAAPATATISADFNGPSIAIDDITGDNIVNAEERDDPAGITISGGTNNVPEGQDVTVQIGGTALTAVPTDANGDWQVTLPQGDPSLPTDGATVAVTADVSDGETDAPTENVDLSADFTAPTIAIDTVEAGGAALGAVMNIAESGETLSVSGTTTDAEAGQPVTVALGGETFTTTTDGTAWSLTILNEDLPEPRRASRMTGQT